MSNRKFKMRHDGGVTFSTNTNKNTGHTRCIIEIQINRHNNRKKLRKTDELVFLMLEIGC